VRRAATSVGCPPEKPYGRGDFGAGGSNAAHGGRHARKRIEARYVLRPLKLRHNGLTCTRTSANFVHETKVEPMDAGCTPNGILPAHLADQIADLTRNDRSSRLAAPQLPGPEQSKAGAMPSYDRLWLDDCQGRAPVAPETGETDPVLRQNSGRL
jgi:hypothetical protein